GGVWCRGAGDDAAGRGRRRCGRRRTGSPARALRRRARAAPHRSFHHPRPGAGARLGGSDRRPGARPRGRRRLGRSDDRARARRGGARRSEDRMRSLAGQVGTLLWKDALAEVRTRELLGGMAVFGLLVLLIFNFAFDLRVDNLVGVGPGVLWVTFTFAGVLGLGRSFVVEKGRGTLDGLLAAPVD